jgi:hypothetical protein
MTLSPYSSTPPPLPPAPTKKNPQPPFLKKKKKKIALPAFFWPYSTYKTVAIALDEVLICEACCSQCFLLCKLLQDHTVSFVSSIFLRRLLCPGVHHNISLRATLLDYNRHWTDSEYQSLTADRLKKEILSLIESEVLFALILWFLIILSTFWF